MHFEVVIGLEVHAQLLTNSKIFCGCNTAFGAAPNSQTCPVCLGMPGVLPVLNEKAIEFAIRTGLATNCRISEFSKFARKNYFYPDLPKGYQISQFELPVCEHGWIEINPEGKESKKIGITRIHLEEDAGKSIHDESIAGEESLVDVNRCGVPLLEIVSEPDMRGPAEAYSYLKELKAILTYLEICDGNMEEGSLRCDANISLRPLGEKKFGTKTEMKNMNSFRNVERALTFEIDRQMKILLTGGTVVQETLLWDADAGVARAMRSKEEAHDYRYFPEPDLVPVITAKDRINLLKESLPELPREKKLRFLKDYEIASADAEILVSEKNLADYFEELSRMTGDAKSSSNWILSDVLRILNENKIGISQFQISPDRLGNLIKLIKAKTISHTAAKKVFSEMLASKDSPEKIVEKMGLSQISSTDDLTPIIDRIFKENPKQVEQYKNGKTNVISFFIGQTMKATKGKANPVMVSEIWKEKLS